MTTYRDEVFCRYMQRSSLRIRELGGDTPETRKDKSQECPLRGCPLRGCPLWECPPWACPPCRPHLRRGVPRLPGRGRLDPGPVRPGRFRVPLLPLGGPSPPFPPPREERMPRGDAP